MEYIGLDLRKQSSQFCILTEKGTIVEKRIPTEHGRFVELLSRRPKATILLEASTESEWVPHSPSDPLRSITTLRSFVFASRSYASTG